MKDSNNNKKKDEVSVKPTDFNYCVMDIYEFAKCGNCGFQVNSSMNYCPKCGTKIDWER